MGNDNHVSIGKTSPKGAMEPDDNDDVEILYMRLQALQTMKDKLDQEDDEMVEEMEELLQEADEARNEEEQNSLIIPIVDEAGMDMIIEEQKEDSMSSVVKRLKEAARKTRQIQPVKLEYDSDEFDDYSPAKSQEDYSPTQSPLRDVPMSDDLDLDMINPVSPEASDDEETVINPTDAEVQFFKQQREEPLFPSSVWEFQPKTDKAENGVVVKEEPQDVDDKGEDMANIEAFHKAVMEQSKAAQTFRRRKRARSKNNQTEETQEDNEKALRAAVLSSMAVKRTKLIEEKEKQEEKSKLEQQKKKKLQLAKKKREEIFKKAKIERDLKQLQEELEKKYTDKSIKNKIEAMPLTRKHFPNLILRRVIISVKDMEEERRIQKDLEQKKNQQFQLNLDSLMKDLRSQSTKPVKAKKAKVPAPPKPARKFPPKKPQSKPKPSASAAASMVQKRVKKPSISLADKENLKKSNISHLPVDKQKEYKALLALLAQKEKAKKTQSKQVKTEVQQTTKPEAEQEATKTEASTEPLQPQELEVEDNRPLPEIESDLIKARKEMSNSLFKLSAIFSTLREEKKKKETAESFLEKLKNQVALTEELIARKNERIVKLKTVVSQSHQDVGQKSMAVARLKKKCKSLGQKLKGPTYQPPQEGIDTIKKKLSVINNSAQKVSNDKKESSSSSSSSSSSEDSSSSDSSSEEDEDSRPSTLAHLTKSSVVLDPQVELCRYDLQGTCNDSACPYQHHRPSKS